MHEGVKQVCAIVAGIAVLSGCAGDAGGVADDAVVRDSAGIRIVESGATAPPLLSLNPEPLVEIGEVEGAPEYQLHDVQHVTRLSDGTIVIANNGSSEVRFYDGAGRHLHSSGRRGGGPGEFESISLMRRLAGDTVLVWDARNRRVTLLGPDGIHVRDFTPEGTDGQVVSGVDAALEDGTLLARGISSFPRGSATSHRDTVRYSIIRGDSVRELQPYAGAERSIEIQEGGGRVVSIMISEVAFGRTAHAAAGHGLFYIGSSDTYEVHQYDAGGALRGIIRSAHVPEQPVTGELFREWGDAALERRERSFRESGLEFDAAAVRKDVEESQRAPSVPLYADLLADQAGGVWVKDYVMPGPDGRPERWTIFAEDGTRRGAIDLPPRFRPMYVDGDTVAGVITDEYDVQYVRVYTLRG